LLGGNALFAVLAAGEDCRTHRRLNSQPSPEATARPRQSAFQSGHRANPTGRIKYGYVVSLEQAIDRQRPECYGRWRAGTYGKTETWAFTDIDASLLRSAPHQGPRDGQARRWIGIGGAIKRAPPGDHRDFIAAGGLGVLTAEAAVSSVFKTLRRQKRNPETYYASRSTSSSR